MAVNRKTAEERKEGRRQESARNTCEQPAAKHHPAAAVGPLECSGRLEVVDDRLRGHTQCWENMSRAVEQLDNILPNHQSEKSSHYERHQDACRSIIQSTASRAQEETNGHALDIHMSCLRAPARQRPDPFAATRMLPGALFCRVKIASRELHVTTPASDFHTRCAPCLHFRVFSMLHTRRPTMDLSSST